MPAKVDASKCTACGQCVEVCPVEAIELGDAAKVDPDTCTSCGLCADECPVEAITLED